MEHDMETTIIWSHVGVISDFYSKEDPYNSLYKNTPVM